MLNTECIQSEFEFERHFSRAVVAHFDGGTMTSDGGALLLRRVDRRLNLLGRAAACFCDRRHPAYVEHSVEQLIAQRVYGLALGYEDLSDHDQLRQDPLLAVVSGKPRVGEELLAGKSTLNRLELSTGEADRYKKIECQTEALDALLVEIFLEAHAVAPERIVLDLDVTDLPLHGHREGRFFHGYYDSYCYLPLYIFCGEHLLCARLRTADRDASAGSKEEVERIVKQIRSRWPAVEIVLRADSGFCREELMAWCEEHGVEYVFGFARNERLRCLIAAAMEEAKRQQQANQEPARVFTEFLYATTTGELEPGAARDRQSRVFGKRRESALCGDQFERGVLAGTSAVRRAVLCPGRDGESHQRTVFFIRCASERRDAARQSSAFLFLSSGLCAGARLATPRPEGNGAGAGASPYHPAAAIEDRRTNPRDRAQGLDLAGLQLPAPKHFRARLGRTPLLRSSTAPEKNSPLS